MSDRNVTYEGRIVLGGLCETCQHWKQEFIRSDGARYCGAEGRMGRTPDVRADGFVVESEGGATLYTGPEFGCVQHTPKAPT